MLYDNALLIEAYTRASLDNPSPLYEAVVEETFMILSDEDGREPEWADDYWLHTPETRPAFGRLLVDALGNLWVAEHVASDLPPATWLVFSPEGHLRGRVGVPANLTLLEAGVSHILGVDPDQRVHRYRLDRRGG